MNIPWLILRNHRMYGIFSDVEANLITQEDHRDIFCMKFPSKVKDSYMSIFHTEKWFKSRSTSVLNGNGTCMIVALHQQFQLLPFSVQVNAKNEIWLRLNSGVW